MDEIEVKILEINKSAIIEKLNMLGARRVFDGDLVTYHFDDELGTLRSKKLHLRLRKSRDESVLTLKVPKEDEEVKIMKETQTAIPDFFALIEIFKAIGIESYSIQKKHRTSFMINNVRVDIDDIPGIPTFLEVEAKNIPDLKSGLKMLGYTLEDSKAWTGKELMDHYQPEGHSRRG